MFTEVGKKITRDDIEEIEKTIGYSIPQQMAECYLEYNGGVPNTPFFYSMISDIELTVQSFLPMKYPDDSNCTVESVYFNYTKKEVFPNCFLPFAIDYGANPICVNLTNGQIVIIWMDLGVVNDKAIKLLANDFEDFLNGLEEEE